MRAPRPHVALLAALVCAGGAGMTAETGMAAEGDRQTAPDMPAPPGSPDLTLPDATRPPSSAADSGARLMRSRFDSDMVRVDEALANLAPAIRRTVDGLARLAEGRGAIDLSDKIRRRREVDIRRRELAIERQRLDALGNTIERWRGGIISLQGATAAPPTGLGQRIALLRRRVSCGHRYAMLADWTTTNGAASATVRRRILGGC